MIVFSEGATLSFDGTSVGQVTSIDGPSTSTASIATTHLGSSTKTYRPSTQIDPGQLTIDLFCNSTNYDYLNDKLVAGSVGDAVIVCTDDTNGSHTWTVESFITDLSLSGIEEDGNVSVSATFQGTEAVTYSYDATGGA